MVGSRGGDADPADLLDQQLIACQNSRTDCANPIGPFARMFMPE